MFPWLSLGELKIPVFFLVQSLNLSLLFAWSASRARAAGLPVRRAVDLLLLLAVSGLAGARLLHVFWEAPDYYSADWMRVLDVGSGGFVYYGGLIAALPAGLLFLRWTGERGTGTWFDFFAPLLSAGTLIGRLGCLLAGCCYGRACDWPWAVRILDENGLVFARHPAPLYSALWELGLLCLILGSEKNRPRFLAKPGSMFAAWAVGHGIGRFLVEFVRDDFRGPGFAGLSPGQVLSLVLIAGATVWIARAARAP